jgi:MoaA/NifB/PqqE/SkfB family radical SAM enzyme
VTRIPVALAEQETEALTGHNVLGFNLTMRCPLRCDFCCYSCHPKRTEDMPLSLALDLVEQAAELGVFGSVGFTGGEPLLMLDELLQIGDALRDAALPFTIATAAHWATDPDEARAIVDALADRGLYHLSLSTDPSHARFVNPAAVINAARAAAARGVGTAIFGAFAPGDGSLETFVPELAEMPGVKLSNRPIAQIGRARRRNAPTYDTPLTCYRPVYHELVVFWDGDVYPCCSVYNRDTDGIRLGNAHRESLRTLWERVEGSLLLRTMKRLGFQRVYEIIEEADPALHARLPMIEPELGACLLCNKLFSDPDLAGEIRRAFADFEVRAVTSLIESMEHELGAGETVELLKAAMTKGDSS